MSATLAPTAPLPPRALATYVQVRQYLADTRRAATRETCPQVAEDVCFVCDEPAREAIVVPCADECCDRCVCTDCAARLGYPID